MTSHQEEILASITSEYPSQVEEMREFGSIELPVPIDYLRSLCEGDPQLIECFDDMIEYFYRYTRDVCIQEGLKHEKDGIQENREQILAMEAPRTALHNAMIDSVRILARNLGAKGKDVSWLTNIDKNGRPGYARFALLTTLHDILKQDHTS